MIKYTIELTEEELKKCQDFANKSAETQREYRSGGSQIRNVGQIRENTLRGKVGETIVKKFLEQKSLDVKNIELDFEIYPRGNWDEQDFTIGKSRISVKSTKLFSRWLLLESKDIERGDVCDYSILVLVNDNFKSGHVKGFVSKKEIIEPNEHTKLLKKGECIPRTGTKLDADNHARHCNNLHNSEEEWVEFIQRSKKKLLLSPITQS